MTNLKAWTLALSLASGGLLGALYFGCLWWSVRRLADRAHPAAWFFSGLIFRLALAMTGFYLALQSGLGAFTACLVGFIAVRMALVRLARQDPPSLNARHAH